jgi:MtN3 and saliva related transmembrane protein
MSIESYTLLGFAAGAITSFGFIPQLIRGYKTKRLDDVSYWMPLVLACGMFLWLIYGILRYDIAIIAANTFGVVCNLLLILMKKWYS